ncbi:MAG: beta-ketoacyl-ACP synthase II [Gammaproteobacteria bacterium]|nr:beta-ketoacyl-ACP synthase II [Gammaproteobacteria bacterium]
MKDDSSRVVITGAGALSPVGNDIPGIWSNLKNGVSGIGLINAFDTTNYSTKICGSIKNFNIEDFISAKDARKLDLFIQYGIAASSLAIENSGLEITADNCHRIGTIIGAGIGGLTTIEKYHSILLDKGPRRISPFFTPGSIINMIAGQVSMKFNLTGPNLAIVTACTTGLHCIGQAARMVAYGDADVVVAGGSEMATTPLSIAGFSSAKALSTRNDSPETASRPWDKDRDGFVLSDGAGIAVVESLEHANKRGANIIAEIIGFGMSSDAYHMTSPPADGAGAALAMRNALNDAQLDTNKIAYINAHGTSTNAGDVAETSAIKSIFGDHARQLSVSSTKSMTGHLLGASGSFETIVTALALQDQVAPPTINLDNPGEGCDLDYVAHTAKEMSMDYALCNSFGFGGTNGSLVLKRFS